MKRGDENGNEIIRLLAMNGTFEMSIADPPTIRSAADISAPLAEHAVAYGKTA